jgi:hypothetical protein
VFIALHDDKSSAPPYLSRLHSTGARSGGICNKPECPSHPPRPPLAPPQPLPSPFPPLPLPSPPQSPPPLPSAVKPDSVNYLVGDTLHNLVCHGRKPDGVCNICRTFFWVWASLGNVVCLHQSHGLGSVNLYSHFKYYHVLIKRVKRVKRFQDL